MIFKNLHQINHSKSPGWVAVSCTCSTSDRQRHTVDRNCSKPASNTLACNVQRAVKQGHSLDKVIDSPLFRHVHSPDCEYQDTDVWQLNTVDQFYAFGLRELTWTAMLVQRSKYSDYKNIPLTNGSAWRIKKKVKHSFFIFLFSFL